jgi:hypothetical protein
MKNEYIHIEKTLPYYPGKYLVYDKARGEKLALFVDYETQFVDLKTKKPLKKITHWAPIPKHP